MGDLDIKDLLKWIGAIALVIIVFAFAVFWIGFHKGEPGNDENGGRGNGGVGAACSILFPNGAGSDDEIGSAIDKWIVQKNSSSPLKGMGEIFAASGRGSGVNPALIAAIALKESSLGTHIPQDSYNPFGRTATDSQPHVVANGRKWYKFSSFEEAIREEGPYIQRVYISQGLNILDDFVKKYCPPSECDVDTYVKQMATWINEMTALANGTLGIGCNSEGGCGLEEIDLTDVDLSGGTPKLMKGAAGQFNQMAKEFHSTTGSKLPITSMYRSHQQQVDLCGSVQPSGHCTNPNANPPGTSMHEAGLAFDARLECKGHPNGLSKQSWNTLNQISKKYQWQLSNTSGGTYCARESWHYDYIGFKDKYWYGQPQITNAINAANNCE